MGTACNERHTAHTKAKIQLDKFYARQMSISETVQTARQQQCARGGRSRKIKINLGIKHGRAQSFGAAFEERHTKLIELGQRDTSSKIRKNKEQGGGRTENGEGPKKRTM